MSYTLGRTPVDDYKYSVGIAYIAIPTDVDRAAYIQDCYRNFTVSVWGEDGSFMNRLPITPEVLNFVEFPVTPGELGSPVVYVTEESQSQPVVIGRFPSLSTLGDTSEGDFKFGRSYQDGHVEIFGSSRNSFLNIGVHSDTQAGTLLLQVAGKQPGKFKVTTIGNNEFIASETNSFSQQGSFVTTSADRTADDDSNDAVFKQSPGEHRFKNNKFYINDGDQPFVLGNHLKTFLSDLIDELSKCTVSTAIGQQPLLNAAQISAFKERTDDFLSIVAYINE
ncbi:hypothetical protein [Chitinophaga arvensicola]|uniref:Uncharacterized protein n=1 Tax=Chitinophaga arvensicola TaxID=29529 RepID=A0A1I0R9K6_9BACT|nr:hypothetical protein [Chitinophaga arvensicola]SEW37452.1 hypothetical protein SAMN04488122_2509 [Chitinophaga arvensicola]